jgi:hypothetical protein
MFIGKMFQLVVAIATPKLSVSVLEITSNALSLVDENPNLPLSQSGKNLAFNAVNVPAVTLDCLIFVLVHSFNQVAATKLFAQAGRHGIHRWRVRLGHIESTDATSAVPAWATALGVKSNWPQVAFNKIIDLD